MASRSGAPPAGWRPGASSKEYLTAAQAERRQNRDAVVDKAGEGEQKGGGGAGPFLPFMIGTAKIAGGSKPADSYLFVQCRDGDAAAAANL
mmetsp:Transcript_39977/g.92060  ORF Transcript_39977/g.92060 Transcript_39977/m.92060 type:complete len:91 (-) Transcript_39977:63-335(-)|eukprot:1847985-Amphidinium_carterae.1